MQVLKLMAGGLLFGKWQVRDLFGVCSAIVAARLDSIPRATMNSQSSQPPKLVLRLRFGQGH